MITDEFDDPQGRYPFYETAVIDDYPALTKRAHKDIRTLSNQVQNTPLTMGAIETIEDIDSMTMQDLEASVTIQSETWTAGTYGPDPALGNRCSLRITLTAGQTVVTTSTQSPVDLSDFAPTDQISLALPNFPASSLDLVNSYVRFKDGTQTVALPFTQVLTTGSVEAVWPLSALGTLLHPTVVEFEFKAIVGCTVTVAAVRLLSPDWTPTTLDINTVTQRLQPTVTRTGTIPTVPFPKLWRTSEIPGEDDPMPVNTKLGVGFYTGAATGANSISLFFRGRREDYLTQLDLDGTYIDGVLTFGTNMDDLDAYGVQPDYGRAMYNPRPQEDYDTMTQADLDGMSQAAMERLPDFISEAWLEIRIRFGATDDVTISTTETDNDSEIIIPANFDPNTEYLATVDVVDNSIRVQIHTLDEFGIVNTMVFDSTQITNDFLILRRKGRLGWTIDLADGDAHLDAIRSRGLVFGEYLSHNFESYTPVEGVRLSVSATPDRVTNLSYKPYNDATLSLDTFTTRSSDGSTKVVTTGLGQGVISQPIVFEDFENTVIKFDINYPQAALDQGYFPELYLVNERGYLLRLVMPGLTGDTWNAIDVETIRALDQQTGTYQVLILQDSGSATFWVDNLAVQQRAVRWAGRATLDDPWGRGGNRWTEFRSLLNSETDGIMLPERDKYLQIRGQTLLQDASIDKIFVKPKYAELGRLVWNIDRRYWPNG